MQFSYLKYNFDDIAIKISKRSNILVMKLQIVGTEFFRIIQFSKSSTTSKIAENINIFIIRFLTYFGKCASIILRKLSN